ncbi:hypothetical protein [Sphingomonas sp. BAUL-RG-20F-R05-02]|uniref:hypothetical protein n=1 Tax=Sphingomonas sp. BAUL-RG-20F-R05-02 TaxID=2914830 RepID=UPI001F585BB2|nr:hypothetical protein [Sphingomonas sp. BAUL-RG-20F-R05-02]
MKTTTVALLAASLALELAGCAKSGDEKLADRVENHADAQADALKNQAAELNAEAKQVRETGKQRGDAIDAADLNTQAMSNEQKAAIVNGAAPAVR